MNRLLRISEQCYRVLLYLYPSAHRRDYGQPMRQTFHDLNHAAYAQNDRRALADLWLHTLIDISVSAGTEHLTVFKRRLSMSKRSLVIWLMTGIFAVITGYVNVNNNEVQAPMACILLFSFILGLVQRRTAWLRAIIIGLSIPMSYFLAFGIRYKPDDPPHLPITTAVLVIPALVAAYAGVLINLGLTPPRQRSS